MPTPAEIKKALVTAGFEVYRTRGEVVHVADRVRENLLMDSGIFIHAAAPAVGFVVKAHRSDFPTEGDEGLFDRARALASASLSRGYREVDAQVRKVLDPGDPDRTLDTWCEVSYELRVADIAQAMDEVRFALSLEKAAGR